MGVGSPAWADDSVARAHQAVLDRAVILAGLQFTRPPLVLTSTLPWTASAGAEAWTTCDADDHGDRIFVYTRSALFQCANQGDWQCMLKLASVLVHEAWHFRNGRDEAGAYTAQITFLMHQGSDATAAGVRRARDRVLAVRGSPVEAVAIKLRERQTSPLP
jgi:hypothetical protein